MFKGLYKVCFDDAIFQPACHANAAKKAEAIAKMRVRCAPAITMRCCTTFDK